MEDKYVENKSFVEIDFSKVFLKLGEYDNCTFTNCSFTNSDLSNITLIDCTFEDCDLSNVKVDNTTFNDVGFENCKILGIVFSDCNDFLFTVKFDGCILNFASFYKLNLKDTLFKNSKIEEVDFTESNLSCAIFNDCNLNGAIFERTNLERVDFRSSYNYRINPEKNKIKGAKFSLSGVVGLLEHYNIKVE